MSALTAVFDTTELLESILRQIDTKTLLLAQRVDTRWHTVIRSSKLLQRKLFFLPTTTFDDILDLFLDIHDPAKFNILDSTSNRCKWLQQVVCLNDVLFDTTREWKLRDVSFARPAPPPDDERVVEPSWKRMLLTQPPPSTGKGDVMFWFEDLRDNDELCEDVDTMGQMMERVYGKANCDVDWDSAAVRPVKHAVDGTYYWRLLNQRKKEARAEEEEEELEVTVFDGKGNVEEGLGLRGFASVSSSSVSASASASSESGGGSVRG